jgi:hypothetical protein
MTSAQTTQMIVHFHSVHCVHSVYSVDGEELRHDECPAAVRR